MLRPTLARGALALLLAAAFAGCAADPGATGASEEGGASPVVAARRPSEPEVRWESSAEAAYDVASRAYVVAYGGRVVAANVSDLRVEAYLVETEDDCRESRRPAKALAAEVFAFGPARAPREVVYDGELRHAALPSLEAPRLHELLLDKDLVLLASCRDLGPFGPP